MTAYQMSAKNQLASSGTFWVSGVSRFVGDVKCDASGSFGNGITVTGNYMSGILKITDDNTALLGNEAYFVPDTSYQRTLSQPIFQPLAGRTFMFTSPYYQYADYRVPISTYIPVRIFANSNPINGVKAFIEFYHNTSNGVIRVGTGTHTNDGTNGGLNLVLNDDETKMSTITTSGFYTPNGFTFEASTFSFKNYMTGGGTALLGTNSPASSVNAPYTWVEVKIGTATCYMPAWLK